MRHRKLLLNYLVAAFLLFAIVVKLSADITKVRNGDLEKVVKNRPDGWVGWTWAPQKAKSEAEVLIVDGKGRSDSRCVKISVKKAGHIGVLSNNYGIINIAGGKKYVLKVYVKTIEADPAKTLRISIGSVGSSVIKIRKDYKLFPTEEWQLLVLPVPAPKSDQRIRIDLSLKDKGTVYIDDICLGEQQAEKDTGSQVPFVMAGRTRQAPQIDGKLTDKCWQQNIECTNFSLVAGKGIAKAQTSAWVTFDERNIYIAFRCLEKYLDPALNQLDRFKANIGKHDQQVYNDDSVEIFLQPSEAQAPFHLIINSKGIIYDRIGKSKPGSWDSNAITAGYIGNGFWTLELAVPLKSLKQKKISYDKAWRVNFCRSRRTIPQAVYSSWAPVPLGFNTPAAFGYLKFTDSVPQVKQGPISLLDNGNCLKGEFYLKNLSSVAHNYYFNSTLNATASGLNWNEEDKRNLAPGKDTEVKFAKKLLNASKHGISFYNFSYYIGSDDKIYYRSPSYKILIGESAKAASSSLYYYLTCDSKGILKARSALYIMEDSVERVSLLLNSSRKKELTGIRLVIDMPLYCRLVNNTSLSPIKISESKQPRDGEQYRRYYLEFDSSKITPSDHLKWNFIPVDLFIEAVGCSPKARNSGKIYYHAETIPEAYVEKEKQMPMVILPPASLKHSDEPLFKFWNWMPFYNITQFSSFIQNKLLNKWSNAGINSLSIDNQLNTPFYRELLKKYSIKSMKMLPTLTAAPNFPLANSYLEVHPQDSELTIEGKPVKLVCIADILNGTSPFLNEIDKVLGDMAKNYEMLELDYEFSVFDHNAPGYSKRNIQMFRRRKNIPDNVALTPELLTTKYREQWIDFRCWQNGEIMRVYRNAIKKANPACLLGAYSGYQRPAMNYGVNWRYWAPHLDYVSCGYGPGNEQTREAIVPKRVVTAGLALFEENLDLSEITCKVFRRLSDWGSIMFFNGGKIDGRFWYAVSRATSVAADFKEFFLNLTKEDSLVIPESKNISVLTHKGNRLVFVFNESDKVRKFTFQNRKLPDNFVALDYETKRIISPTDRISVTVAPKDVKIICLFDPKQFINDLKLIQLTPEDKGKSQSLRPVFRWRDNYPFNKYELECSSGGRKIITAKNVSENYFVPENILAPGKYQWRIRALDITSGKTGQWTVWSEFNVPEERFAPVPERRKSNPSIEKLGNWMPVYWGGWPSNVDTFGKDYAVTRSGTYSLRLAKPEYYAPYWTTMRFCPTGSELPAVRTGERYKFSAWIKTSGAVNASIAIGFKDEYNGGLTGARKLVSKCQEWQRVSVEAKVPNGGLFLNLSLSVSGGRGNAWFDCFELKKIK